MKPTPSPFLPDPASPFTDVPGWPRSALCRGASGARDGAREDGPIRIQLSAVLRARIGDALGRLDGPVRLLECGCGATPDHEILRHCSDYTGSDNCGAELQQARAQFDTVEIPHRFRLTSPCTLPFENGEFDAVFAPRLVASLDNPDRQARAITEMMRVTRRGGILMFLARNPRPILFPAQGTGPDDHSPRVRWMRRALSDCARVCTYTAGLASDGFDRAVTEYRYPGKALWQAVRRVELGMPRLAAHLGCNVLYICRR